MSRLIDVLPIIAWFLESHDDFSYDAYTREYVFGWVEDLYGNEDVHLITDCLCVAIGIAPDTTVCGGYERN